MLAPQKITGEQPVSQDGTTEMGGSEREKQLAGGMTYQNCLTLTS